MEESLLNTRPMVSPAFGPCYNDHEDNLAESSQAQLILNSLNPHLHGIFCNGIRQALELDPLYAKVHKTGNKLPYLISDGLLLAQNTNDYQNLYISMEPLNEGVSLRDFILQSVHEGLGHFTANKCYSYTTCFFWWPKCNKTLFSNVNLVTNIRSTTSLLHSRWVKPSLSLHLTKPTNLLL